MTGEFAIGVHAAVFLSCRRGVHSSEEIAASVCTNPARVRKVLSCLKKAGLVETKEGSEGGYAFSGNDDAVGLDMIADALGVSFVSVSWRKDHGDPECLIASGMDAVMGEIYDSLNLACRSRLRDITIGDIRRRIFPEVHHADIES